MGFRNHLHVCQHCGVVHATSSSTGPRRCAVCDDYDFSAYHPESHVEWKLFGEFKHAVGKKSVAVEVEDGATVADALHLLLDTYPTIAGTVFDDAGEFRPGVHLVVNHDDVTYDDDRFTAPLHDHDELGLFAAVA
ncbi:ubiquitin-like small modifier protein 1 [Haloarchaeobius sp. TZWSO28]|uniref:ubiquitin-like small modifier protein 1 n=1 Tax=unclassified Haloarchaeobius TaxID=2614452 RepID=UPI003EB96DDC